MLGVFALQIQTRLDCKELSFKGQESFDLHLHDEADDYC